MVATRDFAVVVVAAFVAVIGVNSHVLANEEVAAIQGQVLLDGKPLSAGRIILFTDNSDQFVGCKLKDGSFKMDRVHVGKYKVTIEGKGVPAKYTTEEISGLVMEVRVGISDFQFRLKSN